MFMTEVKGGTPSGGLKDTLTPVGSPPPPGVEPANRLTAVPSLLDDPTAIEAEADSPGATLPITG